MRIFCNIKPVLNISRRMSCNYNARQYTSLVQVVRCKRLLTNSNLWLSNPLRKYYNADKSFSSVTQKESKSLKVKENVESNGGNVLLPVALLDLGPLSPKSTKVLLFPLNWPHGNESAMQNALSAIFYQKSNTKRIEAFSNALKQAPVLDESLSISTRAKLLKSAADDTYDQNPKSTISEQPGNLEELSEEPVNVSSASSHPSSSHPSSNETIENAELTPGDNAWHIPQSVENLENSNHNDGQQLAFAIVMKSDALKLNLEELVLQRKFSADPLSLGTRTFSTNMSVFQLPTTYGTNGFLEYSPQKKSSPKTQRSNKAIDPQLMQNDSSSQGYSSLLPLTIRHISSNSSPSKGKHYNSPFVTELLGGQKYPMNSDTYRKALIEAEKRRAALKYAAPAKRLKNCNPERPMVMVLKVLPQSSAKVPKAAVKALGAQNNALNAKVRQRVPKNCTAPESTPQASSTLQRLSCKKASSADNVYLDLYKMPKPRPNENVLQVSKLGLGKSRSASTSMSATKGGKDSGKSKKQRPCDGETEYEPRCNVGDPCAESSNCNKPAGDKAKVCPESEKKDNSTCDKKASATKCDSAKSPAPSRDPCSKKAEKKATSPCRKLDEAQKLAAANSPSPKQEEKRTPVPCVKKETPTCTCAKKAKPSQQEATCDRKETKQPDTCAKKADANEPAPCAKKADANEPAPCAKKADTCVKTSDTCAKKADPCAKKADTCAKKADPCAKKADPCAKKSDPCAKKADANEPAPCAKKADTNKPAPCAIKADKCAKKADRCAKKADLCAKKADESPKQADPVAKNADSCDKKADKCAKKADPCAKKADPCAKKSDTCADKPDPCAKKADKCAKKADPCAQKADPCAKKADPCAKKADPCAKKADVCAKKAEPCAMKAEASTVKAEESAVKADRCPVKAASAKKTEASTVKAEESAVKAEESALKPDRCPVKAASAKKTEASTVKAEESAVKAEESAVKPDRCPVKAASAKKTEASANKPQPIENKPEPIAQKSDTSAKKAEAIKPAPCPKIAFSCAKKAADNKPALGPEPSENKPEASAVKAEESAVKPDRCPVKAASAKKTEASTVKAEESAVKAEESAVKPDRCPVKAASAKKTEASANKPQPIDTSAKKAEAIKPARCPKIALSCAKNADDNKPAPGAKIADPCAKKADSCAKKDDPCGKKADKCAKKSDSDSSVNNPCAKKSDSGADKPNPCDKKADKCAKKADLCSKKSDSDSSAKKASLCAKKTDSCDKKADKCAKKSDPCPKKADKCTKQSEPCAKKADKCPKKSDKCPKKPDKCAKKEPAKPYPCAKLEPVIDDPCNKKSSACSKKGATKADTCVKKEVKKAASDAKEEMKIYDPCAKKGNQAPYDYKSFCQPSTKSFCSANMQKPVDLKPSSRCLSMSAIKFPKLLFETRSSMKFATNNNMKRFGFVRRYSSKGEQSEKDLGDKSRCDSVATKKPAKRVPAYNPHPKDGLRLCYPSYELECPKKLCKDPKNTACCKYAFLRDTDTNKRKENKKSVNGSLNKRRDMFIPHPHIPSISFIAQQKHNFHTTSDWRRKFFPKNLQFFQEPDRQEPMTAHEIYEHNNIKRNDMYNETLSITDAYKVERVIKDIPYLSEYDVLVRTSSIAISGSDIHVYENGTAIYPGISLGHDASGVVVKTGRYITELKRGDRVTMEPSVACGICDVCKRGDYNMCHKLIYNGFFVQYQSHPADLCHKIPDSLSMAEASLCHTLALGCQAISKANISPNSNILIMGCGPTAVAAALCAQAKGAKEVAFLCTMRDTLVAIKDNFYVPCIVNDDGFNNKQLLNTVYECFNAWPDVVVNCAINEDTMKIAALCLKPCGVCVLAQCDTEVVNLNALDVIMKNIRLVPSFRSANMFPCALQLLNSGTVPVNKMIASHFRWDNVSEAFRAAQLEANNGYKKVIVEFSDSGI